jgi:hypothetical protein
MMIINVKGNRIILTEADGSDKGGRVANKIHNFTFIKDNF